MNLYRENARAQMPLLLEDELRDCLRSKQNERGNLFAWWLICAFAPVTLYVVLVELIAIWWVAGSSSHMRATTVVTIAAQLLFFGLVFGGIWLGRREARRALESLNGQMLALQEGRQEPLRLEAIAERQNDGMDIYRLHLHFADTSSITLSTKNEARAKRLRHAIDEFWPSLAAVYEDESSTPNHDQSTELI